MLEAAASSSHCKYRKMG